MSTTHIVTRNVAGRSEGEVGSIILLFLNTRKTTYIRKMWLSQPLICVEEQVMRVIVHSSLNMERINTIKYNK